MSMSLSVISIGDTDLSWGFTDTLPSFAVKDGSYTHREKVDPFPCYGHNLELVRSELDRTARLFELPFPVYLYVSAFECEGRTNAHASTGYDYDAEKVDGEYPIGNGTIVFSGKRIPIMPSMTRYLVSHEYGHLVEDALKKAKRLDVTEYAKMRGCEPRGAEHYGGGEGGKDIGENFSHEFPLILHV